MLAIPSSGPTRTAFRTPRRRWMERASIAARSIPAQAGNSCLPKAVTSTIVAQSIQICVARSTFSNVLTIFTGGFLAAAGEDHTVQFRALLLPELGYLRRVGLALTGSQAATDDLLQETGLRAVR